LRSDVVRGSSPTRRPVPKPAHAFTPWWKQQKRMALSLTPGCWRWCVVCRKQAKAGNGIISCHGIARPRIWSRMPTDQQYRLP